MKIPHSEFKSLIAMLDAVTIPKPDHKSRALTSGPNGRTVYLGHRLRGDKSLMSVFATKHPEIYKEIHKIINKYAPVPMNAFMLNKNYVTQPHIDKINRGVSVLVAFGDYDGGDLIVEGKKVPTRYNMYKMPNGVKHWNEPIKRGTRYSIVGFNV